MEKIIHKYDLESDRDRDYELCIEYNKGNKNITAFMNTVNLCDHYITMFNNLEEDVEIHFILEND